MKYILAIILLAATAQAGTVTIIVARDNGAASTNAFTFNEQRVQPFLDEHNGGGNVHGKLGRILKDLCRDYVRNGVRNLERILAQQQAGQQADAQPDAAQ